MAESTVAVECVLDCATLLGEGPVWNHQRGLLEFVDIMGARLHHFDPRSGRHAVTEVGSHIGAFAPRRDGGYVVAVAEGFGVVAGEGAPLEMVAPVIADDHDLRMNDGKCDRGGRFFAGCMSYRFTPFAGRLFRLEPDWSVHTALDGTTISNGIDWSDDERTMYYVDSGHFALDAFDYDASTGAASHRRRIAEIANDPTSASGITVGDGLTVDAEGGIWVAVHGAGEVRRFAPDGALLQTVRVPVLSVTSVAFGGEGLDELYLTTAGAYPEGVPHDAPGEGGIFVCRPGVRGRPANFFAG